LLSVVLLACVTGS